MTLIRFSHFLRLAFRCLAFLGAVCWAPGVFAHGATKGELSIDHPYAIPSLKGVSSGSTYFRGIRNQGKKPDRLMSASTPVAQRVEFHKMMLEGDVMRMRSIASIELPAGRTTPLRHGGVYHLMLMDLKQALVEGDRFDLTLNFENAGTQVVKVWVQKPRDAAVDAEHKH